MILNAGFLCDEPDPELAALDLGLALALLKDKQHRLGREVLAQAMLHLEPQSFHSLLMRVYAGITEHIIDAATPFTEAA